MDRWQDDDGTLDGVTKPKVQLGRVAQFGMAGFVKSAGAALGTENAQTIGKIEIVASKREQKKAETKAQASRLMPPPPPPPSLAPPPAAAGGQAGPPPKQPPPTWAAAPPAGARMLAYKDGQVVQEISLHQMATIFGRNDFMSDIVLDHPSVSRQHAVVAFDGQGRCMVEDYGSAHGTWVDGVQLEKGKPREFTPSSGELRFAASSRRYRLMLAAPPASTSAQQPAGGGGEAAAAAERPAKRGRVMFADEGDEGGAASGGTGAGPGPGSSKLETVIGYTDGRDFVRVGPKKPGQDQGMFADAVSTKIVSPRSGAGGGGAGGLAGSNEKHPSALQAGAGGLGHEHTSGAAAAAAGPKRPHPDQQDPGARPELLEFVERIRKEPPRKASGDLYDFMPPPSTPSTAAAPAPGANPPRR